MQRISFSDASFFFAIVDATDRWHRECLSLLNELEKKWMAVSHDIVSGRRDSCFIAKAAWLQCRFAVA